MTKPERPFLDFYEKHSVIPTQLEIADQSKFFKQRDFLFETLGIPVHFLKGSNILELGPGTGQKAAHLLSLNPSSYTAIDNNPASVSATNEIIAKSGFKGVSRVINCDFLDFKEAVKYDLIIAELVIPTQLEPELFLKKLSHLLLRGGTFIFTCIDPISLLAETLRKAIVTDLKLISDDLHLSASKISDFFRVDLDLLPGMNRKRTDWAIDMIIKPSVGPILNIPTAINSLAESLRFHGSSPKFVEDYRWYKSPEIFSDDANTAATKSYWMKCHNFLDSRITVAPFEPKVNEKLFELSKDIYSATFEANWTMASRQLVEDRCLAIQQLISRTIPSVAKSLTSFLSYWQSGDSQDLTEFRPWWGRGTQYISMIKR